MKSVREVVVLLSVEHQKLLADLFKGATWTAQNRRDASGQLTVISHEEVRHLLPQSGLIWSVKEVLIIIQKRTEMLWLLPWCWQHAARPAF